MKKYTKVLTLLLGVGIGIGASGFMGNTNNTQTAYANNGIGYTQLSGNYEEEADGNGEYYYNEECYRGSGSRGCGRGNSEGYRNQQYRNGMMNGSGEL